MIFARDGFAVVPSGLSPNALRSISGLIDESVGAKAGARHFNLAAEFEYLIATDGPMARVATQLMRRPMRAVRVLAFDKTPETNWAVPWHQDRAIVVQRRVDIDGFGAWTIKNGAVHVEPPADILENMVALRLHIDRCPIDNGALEVLPGSYRYGRLSSREVSDRAAVEVATACVAESGDIVAIRGLTIHASKRSATPNHRRVLHVDFADRDLPGGLAWGLVQQ